MVCSLGIQQAAKAHVAAQQIIQTGAGESHLVIHLLRALGVIATQLIVCDGLDVGPGMLLMNLLKQ